MIDLSSWYREAIEPKLSLIQTAIEQRHEISFDYYAPDKESHRTIEPYFLIFKWSSWYVYGWCKTREDFRLFKLNRMAEISCGQAVYEVRKVPAPDLSVKKRFPGGIYVEAVFTPDVKWRVVEEYGPYCFTEDKAGNICFKGEYTDFESLVSWMLTFGDKVTVTEPKKLRDELFKRAGNIVKKYGLNGIKKLLRGLGSCISGSGDTGAGRRRIPAKNSFMVIGSGSINGGISCVCGLFH